jgi:polyisoprenyl-teichoic acid--peptidoglycan teichoic acid transferase
MRQSPFAKRPIRRTAPTKTPVVVRAQQATPVNAHNNRARTSSWKKRALAAIVLVGGIFALLAGFGMFTDAGSRLLFSLNGERSGRTNILLLGIGGEKHPGGNLADSIMMVSIDHKSKRIGLLSVPRDLQVTTDYGTTKINAVHASALNKKQDGPGAMKKIVTEITGQPIHYYARLDFPGFVEFIDILGGIDVRVEKSFYDYYYPNPKYGGKISFKEGTEHLNGEWALNYARSRYGDNGEGSDFRRAKRHQDIIQGIKQKAHQDKTYVDIGKITNIMGVLNEHLHTDISNRDLARLLRIYKTYGDGEAITAVYDNSANGPLASGRSNSGAYILRTKTGDYSQTRDIAARMFDGVRTEEEQATVEVQNGGGVSGLATKTAEELKSLGFTIVEVTNAENHSYSANTVIDTTGGKKKQSRELLKRELSAQVIDRTNADSVADFIIIMVQ